jgi:Family of unknown function (DUF5317)
LPLVARCDCRAVAQASRARADHADVLIGLVFLACVATVPLAGGRIAALADLRFRAAGLLMAAIVAQVLIVSVFPQGSATFHNAVHIATYVVVAVFVVLNRRIPWVWLVALGGALNFAAIAANGGVMPAAPRALRGAGFALDPAGFTNSGAVSHPHLQFLGDVFWIPSSFPISNVFSVGDVLILLGALLAMHCVCASRLALRRFAVPAV